MKSAIELCGITKKFGSVLANNNVSLLIEKGEILALLGENGSGKTTLMNIISGIYYPDSGDILVDGNEVTIASPKDAFDYGIGMIHQHFKLVDVLTAAENVVLGLPNKGRLNMTKQVKKIKTIAEKYGFDFKPYKKVYDMSVSEKQTVEIIKVLFRGAQTLILDEPTAVLTPQEADKLFNVLRNMKQDGKAVIIITHKLNEVMAISDKVAVLRKGEYIGTVNTSETNPQSLTDMMVGRAVSLDIDRPPVENPKDRLCVKGLTCLSSDGLKVLDNISFTSRSGEILGIAGISGSGQRELCEAIAGLYPVNQGSIEYIPRNGSEKHELVGKNPLTIRKFGVSLAFVPEDRLGMGLVAGMGMVGNMMLRSYNIGKSPFADKRPPQELAENVIKQLEVSTPSAETPVSRLSGGNVQKVLLGREIASSPNVIMAAYPVRGLDINSSYTVYHLLNEQKKAGVAVIYVGEDLDALIQLCDRILVLCDGQVSGIVDGRTATKEQLGLLMTQLGGENAGGDK